MKKKLIISFILFIILINIFIINYATTSTLNEISNNINSFVDEVQFQIAPSFELSVLNYTSTATNNELTIYLSRKNDSNIDINTSYTYVLSENILTRTISNSNSADNNEYEYLTFRILMDCIGQLHGYSSGDLFNCINLEDIYDYTLENEGISLKETKDNIDFKLDITKTIDFSNTYIEASEIKEFTCYTKGLVQLDYMNINRKYLYKRKK